MPRCPKIAVCISNGTTCRRDNLINVIFTRLRSEPER